MKKHQLLFAARLLLRHRRLLQRLGPGRRPGAPIARGEAALEQGQPRTARIEFLNAIKADPNDGKLRLAQARTYLLLGDGVAAEAELAPRPAARHPVAETRT
jgi:Tfp pilus assembly protein PilF